MQQENEQGVFKPENIPTNHPIWELWKYFSRYYGAAFVSQYGDMPNEVWLYELRNLTAEQYREGINNLSHHEGAFAPNPGEFLILVHNGATAQERASHKRWQPGQLLEDKTAREQRQEFSVEQARSLLDNF